MAFLKTLMASLALVLTSVSVIAPAATAQGTKVVVIDQARIMRDSAAGKDIVAKIGAIEQQMMAEIQPAATEIQTEGAALEARTANMTPETIAADAALVSQVQAFQQKMQQYNQDRTIRAQELGLTERKAWVAFFQALEPVLQQVVDENGAGVMLERSELVFAGDSVDVTDSVITKLDAATPRITVTRERAPTAAPTAQ